MPEIIYESEMAVPPLPETSLFHYFFPDATSKSPLNQFDPSLPAFTDGIDGRVLTRGALKEGALRLASGLKGIGAKRKDTVCFWGLNSLEWIVAAFGCMAAGLTISPANAGYMPTELAHQVNNSDSSFIFVDPEFLPAFDKARSELKLKFTASKVILLCNKERKPAGSPYKSIYELFGEPAKAAERFDGLKEAQTTAWMCYSSGTTGLPKGVELTNHNLTSQLQAVNIAFPPLDSGKDVVLGFLPFSHIFGLVICIFQPLTTGVPVVLLPRFEPTSVFNAVQKYKTTFALVVPPIILAFLHSPETAKYDLSSLKTLMCGAAPLSEDVIQMFESKYPNIQLTQGYGQTETAPAVTTSDGVRRGWAGYLIPTWQARLVKEDGEDAARGEAGELWVRGPSTMKGYYKNEEANDKAFASGQDGRWLKTGDVLVRDEGDGNYKVVDRIKELIKYKGFQVAPAELEALLLTHPKVMDAGVIGVYNAQQATEIPRAYIVAKPGVSAVGLEKEVSDWVTERVAAHKKLRGGVVVIGAIPKSPSGKILRKDLRKQAEEELGTEQKAKL